MHQGSVKRESGARRKTELARTALAVARLAGRASRARHHDNGSRAGRRTTARTRPRRRP
jgi:hypothetical protein